MSLTFTCEKKCCKVEVGNFGKHFPRHAHRGQVRKAGVFIYDPEEDRVILVQSRGLLWGLPKGTLETDRNEISQDCAIREVKEETGLDVSWTNFTRATIVKNRATYFYMEKKYCEVHPQNTVVNNDANGITWIKLSCLEECIRSGQIVLNQHCRIVFKRFLNKTFPKSDFVMIESRHKK